jgi:hypothetical protein
MTLPETTAATLPTRRRDVVLAVLIVLAVGLPIYGWIAAYNLSTQAFQDAMEYLTMADFFRQSWAGTPTAAAAEYFGITRLPPLFPAVLAVFGAGTGAAGQHMASIVTVGTAILAALLTWFWQYRETGAVARATVIAIALLLYPAYFIFNLYPLSEPLAMALLAATFAVLVGKPTSSQLLLAGLLIGLTVLARSAFLPLVIAFAIWLVQTRPTPPRHWVAPLLAAVAPFAAWLGYRKLLASRSYFEAMTPEMLLRELGGWPEALWLQPTRLFNALQGNWESDPGVMTLVATLLLVVLTVAGTVLRARDGRIDAWFLMGYVALILVWPYPLELGRFMMAVYPLCLVGCFSAAGAMHKWRPRMHPAVVPSALMLAIALATGPAIGKFIHRASLPVPDELLGDKREGPFFQVDTDDRALAAAEVLARNRFLVEEAAQHIASHECAYSVHPELLRLHGGIRGVHYPRDLDDVAPAITAERLNECDWFFLAGFSVSGPAAPALYPVANLVGWTERVLMSTFERNDKTIVAAALLQRRPVEADGPDPTPALE